MTFTDLSGKEKVEDKWCYDECLTSYIASMMTDQPCVPATAFHGHIKGENEEVDWALMWQMEPGEELAESYVNLIPTAQGGTHVNGLRSGLLDALREFCEFRSLLPRGVKLSPEDIWERCCYVLSVKLQDPQFSGQTKERLSSRESAAYVTSIIKDSFSLWLNQHPESGDLIAQLAIERAQKRIKSAKKVVRKKIVSGPASPGKLADCTSQEPE